MIAGLVTIAALAGTLDVSDRTELRLRYPGIQAGAASMDLQTDPDAKLTLGTRTSTYVLEYSPQLVAWDVNIVGVHPDYLNRGMASAEWRGQHARLSLKEAASYGTVSFASLALSPGPNGAPAPVNVFPTTNTFLYESTTSTLLAEWAPSRRWLLTLTGAYQVAGGADATSRATLPLESGPLATAGADFALSRRDHAITTAEGSYAAFSTGVDGALVELDEAWRHSLARTASLLVRGGISEAATRGISPQDTPEGPTAPFHLETDPVVEVSLVNDLSGSRSRSDLTISGRLGPTVNPLIGLVDERVGGTIAGHYSQGPVALRAQATLSESLPPSRITGVTLFYSEVAASYKLSRVVGVEIGSRTLWQEPSATTAELASAPRNALYLPTPVVQQVVFAAVIIKADTVRF